MAVLSDSERAALNQAFQSGVSARAEAFGALTKADIRAAVNAADAWADANAVAYNQALPQPARSALTARQKAEILLYVIRRRYEVS